MKNIPLVFLGLILALPAAAQQQEDQSTDEASQRERAIELCKASRGTDCETDASIAQWQMKERERSEAEDEGSRSIHQNAPKPAPRPAN
jgi:hypothetical protein